MGFPVPHRSRAAAPLALSVAVSLAVLAGCAVGPDYVAPEPDAPAAWHDAAGTAVDTAPADPDTLAAWWTTLDDPVLTGLVDRAVRGNQDLRQARGRLRQARAQRGVATADYFPSVTGSAGASRGKGAANLGSGRYANLYTAGFDATWELDLFGGKRRAVEAARADVDAGEADLRDVLVSLLAELATNYVDLRTFQERLAFAQANLKAQTETYDLTRWRAQAGLTTDLDVQQARRNLEQTRAEIPSLEAGLTQAANHLATLVGVPAGSLDDLLRRTGPIPSAPARVAVGVPADTLRQRPDVRRAERRLAAQTARIGVAQANRFPSLSLAGSIGVEPLVPGKLFESGAQTVSGRTTLAQSIFDAGALKDNVQVQDALQEQALAAYRAAVLTALEDVEGALASYASERDRKDALGRAADAARLAADLARDQYTSGLIDFQTVLDAQRSLLSLQDQLAVSEGAVTSDVIRLYKALGGGWASLQAPGAPDAPVTP
jgi:NodT family efflux transporter outer membrane factor (OMF) lipoprotein